MNSPSEQLQSLDRVVHEPVRLAILTALEACETAEYLYLQRLTGCSAGNLSSHLRRLVEAGYIEMTKSIAGNVVQTNVSLTKSGRDAIAAYWKQMNSLQSAIGKHALRQLRASQRPA